MSLVTLIGLGLCWAEDEKKQWDVNNPPGEKQVVQINTDEGTWMSLDVSPDGSKIVFDLLGDIYVMPLTGGKATSLTTGMAWDMQPQFSPDGSTIAFTSDRGGGDNIWLMDLATKEFTAVSKESFRLLNSPTWSPDGQYLVARKHFTSRRSLGAGEMWLYDIAGGNGLQVTKKDSEQKDTGEPAFSPDGQFLYYSKDVSAGNTFQYNKDPNKEIYAIERIDLHSGEKKRVVGGYGGAIRPTPSPDGKTLAFLRRVRAKTVLMLRNLQSGEELELIDNLDRDMQETWAIHGVYPRFDWTPDGKNLVYWANGKINRLEIATLRSSIIPFQIDTTREILPALRYPVSVSPESFPVKMIRDAQVSPDKKAVVYHAVGHLWIRALPDGTPKRLTKQEDSFAFDPSWSPDGKWIVYASWNDQKLGGIYRIRANGKKRKKLKVGKGHFRTPVYTPDGRSIVYKKIGGGWRRSQLWSNETGLYQHNLKSKQSLLLHKSGSNPHFSKDKLYFNSWQDGAMTLQQLDMITRQKIKVAHLKMGNELRISPDGKWIVFKQHHNVHLMRYAKTGKSLSVSKSDKAVPVVRLSKDFGKDVHIAGDKVYWTRGSELMERGKLSEETSAFSLGFSMPTAKRTGVSAIQGARIVTMRNKEVIEKGTVVWKGDRIIAVGSDVKPPKNATIYNGEGLTIMPGLVDVHFHGGQSEGGIIPQQNWTNLSALSFGVTTVHDPSHNTEMIFSAAELQKAGKILAPRIFSTGTILYGAKSAGATATINGLDDAVDHVTRMQAAGAISVKSYNQPRRDQRQQIITAARDLKMMVVPEGGSLLQHNLTQIIDGHTGIEHAIPVAPLYEDVLQLWSQTKVGYTPTLGVAYGGMMGEHFWYANTEVWDSQRLLSFVPQRLIDAASRRATKLPMNEYHHITISKSVKQLYDKGVNIQLGAHGQREGLAAHWELWMFVQGGMSAHEAWEAGTIHSARYLGFDSDIGSIEVGKLADFAVLNKNPLLDIKNSDAVQWTVLGGDVYDSQTMKVLEQ